MELIQQRLYTYDDVSLFGLNQDAKGADGKKPKASGRSPASRFVHQDRRTSEFLSQD
ncbi:MAG: hypothetical protein WB773_31500 [Isosphaeraceae bacterium]